MKVESRKKFPRKRRGKEEGMLGRRGGEGREEKLFFSPPLLAYYGVVGLRLAGGWESGRAGDYRFPRGCEAVPSLTLALLLRSFLLEAEQATEAELKRRRGKKSWGGRRGNPSPTLRIYVGFEAASAASASHGRCSVIIAVVSLGSTCAFRCQSKRMSPLTNSLGMSP